jgi:LacI family transcriptional regulator
MGEYYSKNPGIKGVFVTNSKASLLSQFHRENQLKIRLVGFDLVDGNIEHLKNGGIDYIISQSPVQQGKRAVRTLFDFFVYEKTPEKIQHVPLDVIIRENVDFYIQFNGQNFNGYYK